MDYRQLPVGRRRANAYASSVESRRIRQLQNRRQRNYNNNRNNISFIRDIRISPIQTIYRVQVFNYDNLEDVKIGLINKNIFKYTKVHVNDLKDQTCVICQEDIKVKDIVRTITKCKHIYHIDCIDKWFMENKKCPMCKFVLE